MFNSIHICIISNHLTIMVKILARGYNSDTKAEQPQKQKGATNIKRKAEKTGETKPTYFPSRCVGWHPGTCQVEVVRRDKMVIDLEFIHPLLFTFDKLPSLILLVPPYLF